MVTVDSNGSNRKDRYAFIKYHRRELLNMIGNEQKRPFYSENSKKQARIA
jgi:hypothetical protein